MSGGGRLTVKENKGQDTRWLSVPFCSRLLLPCKPLAVEPPDTIAVRKPRGQGGGHFVVVVVVATAGAAFKFLFVCFEIRFHFVALVALNSENSPASAS